MIKLEVKTKWKGTVAIRDKFYNHCVNKKCGMEITCNKKVMTLSLEQVMKPAFKSKFPFYDKYSNQSHYLYYYQWKPNLKNPPLTNNLFKACDVKDTGTEACPDIIS